MKLLVATDAHIFETPDGKYWSKAIYSYDFWTRYLAVFDVVKVVARVKKIGQSDVKLKRVDGKGVEIFAIPFYQGPKQLLRKYNQINRRLKGVDYDCDAALFRMPSQTASMAYKHIKKSIPIAGEIVYDPTDDVLHSRGIMKIINAIISKNLKKFCLKANGVSYVTESTIQKNYPSKARIVGTSECFFESAYSTITLSENAFTGPRVFKNVKKLIIVMSDVAMNTERKGERTLINVVKEVKKRGFCISAVIIGDGIKKNEFEEYAKKIGVIGDINFTGLLPNSDEVRRVLLNADIFVFPTQAEGLPRGILEAMALGMPVLSTPVGGIPEIIEKKYLFDPLDVNGFSNMLCNLFNDNEQLNDMSYNNYMKAKEFGNVILQQKRNDFYRKLSNMVK